MTVNSPPIVGKEAPDTHDMVVVHRAFRRESKLLAELVDAVPDGDVARAGVLAAHLHWYGRGLDGHHRGEDQLIWPLLLARTDEESLVGRMESQHERVAETLEQVMSALPPWQVTAGSATRDDLVAALVAHRGALIEHLDDEEANMLPLASRHLSRQEWAALGDHFVETTPKAQLLVFLGAVLEEASPAEAAAVLGAMPRAARLIWRTVGRVIYPRRMRRVRG